MHAAKIDDLAFRVSNLCCDMRAFRLAIANHSQEQKKSPLQGWVPREHALIQPFIKIPNSDALCGALLFLASSTLYSRDFHIIHCTCLACLALRLLNTALIDDCKNQCALKALCFEVTPWMSHGTTP